MRKKDVYETGDVLCDMHDGFRNLPDNLEVVAHIRLKHDHASAVEELILGGWATNKELVIAGYDPSYSHYVAVYNYDGTTFGMVELHLKDGPHKEEINPLDRCNFVD